MKRWKYYRVIFIIIFLFVFLWKNVIFWSFFSSFYCFKLRLFISFHCVVDGKSVVFFFLIFIFIEHHCTFTINLNILQKLLSTLLMFYIFIFFHCPCDKILDNVKFVYFVEETKCWLIEKKKKKMENDFVQNLFKNDFFFFWLIKFWLWISFL